MSQSDNFSFNISLSVLNHLGRNLYRSFVTVLGEAISNSWDADAKNVLIFLDKDNDSFVIKDDGDGMSAADFQNKFLKIGYSKRKGGGRRTKGKRPFIGRKGIGKLALLSCADKITVISKRKNGSYVGGCIENSGLDQAIHDDLTPEQYPLQPWDQNDFKKYTKGHEKGTIILFEGIHGGIKNTLSYIQKIVALYFRFALIDKKFNIIIDGKKVTHKDMMEFGSKTQFIWTINDHKDPFIKDCLTFLKESENISSELGIKGFVASVVKPSHLKIRETDEKVTVDLFVNGRLREKNILKNVPTNRIVESYIYGQIHFDELDDNDDPFTSSREGVVSDNHSYKLFLAEIKNKILPKIIEQWDVFRERHGNDGDPDNTRMTRKQRKSQELYSSVASELSPDKGDANKTLVDSWVNDLKDDASFCFASYAECYISENLIRRYIVEKNIPISRDAKRQISDYKGRENDAKAKGNISIDLRKNDHDLSYLNMTELSGMLDKQDKATKNSLHRDSAEYKPMRDALMHTALLSDVAKNKLNTVYENIKGRLKQLLSASGNKVGGSRKASKKQRKKKRK